MTTPPVPVREHAPWTIWLTAVCIWLRASVGLLMATGMFAAGFDPRLQAEAGGPGLLMALSFAVLIASVAWFCVSLSLLRRRRWARRTAIAFEAATVLFGAFNTAYTNGSSLIGLFYLVFGALALVVVLMGPSIHWCSK
jgi:hypothetical protein